MTEDARTHATWCASHTIAPHEWLPKPCNCGPNDRRQRDRRTRPPESEPSETTEAREKRHQTLWAQLAIKAAIMAIPTDSSKAPAGTQILVLMAEIEEQSRARALPESKETDDG